MWRIFLVILIGSFISGRLITDNNKFNKQERMIPYQNGQNFQPSPKGNWTPSDELGFFDLDLQYYRQINDQIYMAWTPTEDVFTIAIAANTLGWLGFGVSETGAMIHAEICAVYDDSGSGNGEMNIFTHFSQNYTYPALSLNQHCRLINYTAVNGESMAIFTRNTISCKDKENGMFGVDLYSEWDNRFIFAYGVDDSKIFSYHGVNVGTSEFNAVLGPPPTYELPPDTQIHNAHMKPHEIPPIRELYLCVPGEFPSDKRYHVILTRPHFPNVIEPAQHHHLNVFVCPFLNNWPPNYQDGEQKECQNPFGLECFVYWYSWLMGQQDTWWYDAGLPIGQDAAIYYVMQEHIHNPYDSVGLYDEGWGLDFYYTATLRAEECGNLGIMQFLPVSGIPPRTANFTVSSECGGECSAALIPEGGIEIMAVMPHMHLVGVEIALEHYRYNSTTMKWNQLPDIHRLNHWDALWQGWRHRREGLKVMPGDYYRLRCLYDSSNWETPVYNGEGYADEMCMMPIMVKPRLQGTACFSLDLGIADEGNTFCIVDVPLTVAPMEPIYEVDYVASPPPLQNCPISNLTKLAE